MVDQYNFDAGICYGVRLNDLAKKLPWGASFAHWYAKEVEGFKPTGIFDKSGWEQLHEYVTKNKRPLQIVRYNNLKNPELILAATESIQYVASGEVCELADITFSYLPDFRYEIKTFLNNYPQIDAEEEPKWYLFTGNR